MRKQASVLDGQASAYSVVSSVVYNVLNGYIVQAERSLAFENEKKEEEPTIPVEISSPSAKPSIKKSKQKAA